MEVMHAKKAAQRCWQAALEHMEVGDFRTAGALIGAVGRYIEQIHDEEGEMTLGQVITFPADHLRLYAAGERANASELG